MKHLLSIGIIPADCSEHYIMVGDPDSFGGNELTLSIDEDDDSHVTCLENKISVETGNFFDSKDPMYKKIIEEITEPLLSHGSLLTPQKLADAWAFFMEELEEMPAYIEVVSDEEGGGEFLNSSGKYNGNVYLRYQVEDDGEYFKEKIIVLTE